MSSADNMETDSPVARIDNEAIEGIVKEIQSAPISEERRQAYYTNKYPDFVESHPMLFDMACRKDFDWEKFNYMMSLRKQIETADRTVDDTSKEVGQKFYDIYMNHKKVKL